MSRTATTPEVSGTCDARFTEVRNRFEQSFREGDELGAAVSITLHGVPVVDLWGGYKDQAGTQPWEHDTLVNLYSTTKGLTALCALRLVEQRKLDLDATVATYWPEFAAAGDPRGHGRRQRCREPADAGLHQSIGNRRPQQRALSSGGDPGDQWSLVGKRTRTPLWGSRQRRSTQRRPRTIARHHRVGAKPTSAGH